MKKIIITLAACACASATVTPVSVSPSSGSGASQQFTFTYTSTNGPGDIGNLMASFAPSIISGGMVAGPCRVQSSAQNGLVQLYKDDGSISTGYLGTSGSLSNGHCSVNLLTSWQYATGTQAWFAPDMTFIDNPVNIFASISDIHANWPGFIQVGTWSLSGGGGPAITPTGISPNGGATSAQQFTITYNAAGGPSSISKLMASFGTAVGNCRVESNAQTGQLTLYNGSTPINGWLGTSGSLSNGYCSVNQATSWQYATGTIAYFAPDMTFLSPSAGGISIFGNATNINGTTGNWATLGGWTVPSGGGGVRKGDSVVTQNIDDTYPQYGIDALTGATVLMPTTLHPLVSLNLRTATEVWPDSIPSGQTYTVNIRHAKPSTQVWARVMMSDEQALICYKPDPVNNVIAQVASDEDTIEKVGWFLGYTDSSGYFQFTGKVPPNYVAPPAYTTVPYETNSVQIHVGTISGGEAYTTNPYLFLDDSTYIGAVTFISYEGNTAPPVFSLTSQPMYTVPDQPTKGGVSKP